MSKRTGSSGLGSIGSGALTAGSLLVVSVAAGAIGIVIAREFGRSAETDGLLAAYGVFVVIAIAAQAMRLVVLPELARARQDGRLASEVGGIALALGIVAVPLLVGSQVADGWLAGALTGDESALARDTAAETLRWVVPASVAHLFAALAASALAALDDYATAAVGYATGGVLGVALIVVRVDEDGIVAVPWGMTLNSGVALAVPSLVLVARAVGSRMPRSAVRPSGPSAPARLTAIAVGVALPLAQQLLYLLCLPFAARQGTGAATSFVYAYLAAVSLVMVTAGSLGLVTSVPLTRAGLTTRRMAEHIVGASWLALVFVGAAAGAFALAGGTVVETVLGGAYGGDVGAEVGRVVVVLSLWMVASVGIAVTFPIAFVVGRTRALPWIAALALAIQLPLAWAGGRVLDLDGLALALGVTTLVVLLALLADISVLSEALRGIAVGAVVVGVVALVTFGLPALLLDALTSAVVGVMLYTALLLLLRPPGLQAGWRYLRALA